MGRWSGAGTVADVCEKGMRLCMMSSFESSDHKSQTLYAPAVKHGSLEYRPAIDGLRALAVLSVFVFHLNHKWLVGGFVGVDIFFVISGYLITSIICGEIQSNSFSIRRFYQRRIARIFPAFFTVGLATLLGAYYVYSPQDLASTGANLSAAALSLANVKLMFQGNYFQISPDAQPFLHYWSLSVEEQFYLIFPLVLLGMFKLFRKRLILLLAIIGAGSFLASLWMTHSKPVWAFYLLPTRAWELLAGCVLAISASKGKPKLQPAISKLISLLGLVLVLASFVFIHEGEEFLGFWALLPVIGTVGLLMPVSTGTASEKLLASGFLVAVGQMSYSLYLWHWPIFSLIDYKMYLASEPIRLVLKIGLSFFAAIMSYWLIENPARIWLNKKANMLPAYAAMGCAVVICVSLGYNVRKANYVNAELSDVHSGGVVFDFGNNAKSVILMGDSNGSMYGKVMKSICSELGYKLTVISVAAGDPLPSSKGKSSQLWRDSLEVVNREKPDCLVLACAWESKLRNDEDRLEMAVNALKPSVGHLVILNQPPILPDNVNRALIRDGARPPFFENAETHRRRLQTNKFLQSLAADNCSIIDIASNFQKPDGEVLFLDEKGRLLYQDARHLSDFGADFIRSELKSAIESNN